MPVTKKTKVLKEEVKTTYVCDMLFREFPESEIHRTYRHKHFCISREAVRRLPASVASDGFLLERVLFGCGMESDGFQPEMLRHGIWVLTTLDESSDRCCLRNTLDISYGVSRFGGSTADRFESVAQVENWIGSEYAGEEGRSFWIFEGGEVVRTYHTKVTLVPGLPGQVKVPEQGETR